MKVTGKTPEKRFALLEFSFSSTKKTPEYLLADLELLTTNV